MVFGRWSSFKRNHAVTTNDIRYTHWRTHMVCRTYTDCVWPATPGNGLIFLKVENRRKNLPHIALDANRTNRQIVEASLVVWPPAAPHIKKLYLECATSKLCLQHVPNVCQTLYALVFVILTTRHTKYHTKLNHILEKMFYMCLWATVPPMLYAGWWFSPFIPPQKYLRIVLPQIVYWKRKTFADHVSTSLAKRAPNHFPSDLAKSKLRAFPLICIFRFIARWTTKYI